MFFWDPTYIIVLPAILLALYAQLRVKATYGKYSQVPVASGLTGAEAAAEILRRNGLSGVRIERIDGTLTDHYDPRTRVLRLSSDVYDGASVAAVGVAAHESGHALQHADNYGPLALRSAIVPVTQFGSWLAWPIFLIGFFFHSGTFMQLGILIFSAFVAFTVITLPVEFDASGRALRVLAGGPSGAGRLMTEGELRGVRAVLGAAALTYVAAAATAILELLRLILLSNMSRREE
ncbi:MAG TPA: zinc metallopeptidase [bacterium]|nr:zinc metallopeptidase [bacterium]